MYWKMFENKLKEKVLKKYIILGHTNNGQKKKHYILFKNM